MSVIMKPNASLKGCFDIYIKDAVLYYARVHEPMDKMNEPKPGVGNQSKRQYSVTVFVSDEDREKLEDEVMINKQLFKVGKDKNKKRVIKFPLYKKDAEGNDVEAFAGVEGLNGVQLIQHEFNKSGNPNRLAIIGPDKQPLTENIGNGSKGHVKLFGYKNQEGLMNVLLTAVMVTDHIPFESGGGGNSNTFVDDEFGVSIDLPEAKKVEEKDQGVGQQDDSEDYGEDFDEEDVF